MTYDEWEATVPAEMHTVPCWQVQAYRLGCFIAAAAEIDTEPLLADPRFVKAAAQLCDAAGSISPNLAEGYSRFSAAARIQFYEYAHGSASEATTRYFNARRKLDPALLPSRLALLGSISRLTLTMIQSERRKLRPPKPRKPREE